MHLLTDKDTLYLMAQVMSSKDSLHVSGRCRKFFNNQNCDIDSCNYVVEMQLSMVANEHRFAINSR